MHVVATAGHVDHGKSTLVLSLTGTDPDRWAEEKARGLTIDLGFAHTTLPSGAGISFVDVPGHIRFLKNMLAGVGAVDACLFVVAATEGWKPQSEEHLRILELLGISHGVIALTKVGLVDEEWAELARMDVADRVRGTFLADAPIIAVDAPTGIGLDELRSTLDALLATTPTARDRGRPRLWIDRVFAARGAGTVVTGTLVGGTLRVDDEVQLVGPEVDALARVRGLQSHGASQTSIGPGNRVAINLGGITHDRLARGDALVIPGQWHRTARFDASIHTLASLDHDLSRRGAFAVYLGAGEHACKVRVLGAEATAPGTDGLVRIHLPVALPLLPGDRFILRDHGRSETIGGGEVLDVEPIRAASRARPDRDIHRLVAERGWVPLDHLARLTDTPWDGPVLAGMAVTEPAVAAERDRIRAAVIAAGPMGFDIAALDERGRAVLDLVADDGIVVANGRATLQAAPDPLADHPFIAALAAGRFSPPDATGIDRAELRELIRRGLVIERDGVWFAPSTIEEASTIVARLLATTNPEGVTVADVRDALGTTRKHVLPLLAHLDATGVTRRRGDLRIAGPKLPQT